LFTKYYSGYQIEKNEMGEACGTNGKQATCIHICDGETLGKEITRHSWEDNIKMDLGEMGWGAWTGLLWLGIGTGGGLL
jgi:hypothetical protein